MYYPTQISPFIGLKKYSEALVEKAYLDTSGEADFYAFFTENKIDDFKPWRLIRTIEAIQMVHENEPNPIELTTQIFPLSEVHIPQMLELTQPGPFRSKTIDFVHYQGIFDGDKLVAMTGLRMNPQPYAEVSAVCTHPDYVGCGYAAQLIMSQIYRMKAKDETSFLHVAAENERAIKVYERMGFVNRKTLKIYIVRK